MSSKNCWYIAALSAALHAMLNREHSTQAVSNRAAA